MTLNTRTLYYNDFVTKITMGQPFSTQENTTLNEKFNLNVTAVVLPEKEYPRLGYFAIGNGNEKTIDMQTDGVLHRNSHQARDAALFNHIPFIARPVDSDLSNDEQENYRLRVVYDINGTDYAFYYLKAIDTSYISSDYIKLSYQNGGDLELDVYEFLPDALSPTPTNINSMVDNEVSTSIVVSNKLPFILTSNDMSEIKNAVTILIGSGVVPADYNINELALCTGYDKTINGVLETIYTQVAFFIDIDYDIGTLLIFGEDINREIEIGSTDRFFMPDVEDEFL